LIIIPFNPTINSLGTTFNSYKRVRELGVPILFVANAVIKEKDALELGVAVGIKWLSTF